MPDVPANGPGNTNIGDIVESPDPSRRGFLIDLQDHETMPFAFAPEPINEVLRANYSKVSPIGMSHGYHSFQGTENVGISFDLEWNRLLLVARTGESAKFVQEKMQEARRFLESLTLPPELPVGTVGGDPPPVLVVIPNILMLRTRLMSLEISFTKMDGQNNPIEFIARTTWEEAPVIRITKGEHRSTGMFRSWGESSTLGEGDFRWINRQQTVEEG